MTYSDINANAVNALNSYVWKLLQVNLDMKAADYGGTLPFAMNQMPPELMATGKAFLVYGYSIQPPNHLYALRTESIAYSVWGTSGTEVNRICNLLADCFERQDEAAADVNSWLGIEGRNRGITFGTIRLSMVEQAQPSDQEGGFVQGLVLLEMRYTLNTARGAKFSGFTL